MHPREALKLGETLLMECLNGASVAIRRADPPIVRTTDGATALLNLRAQIDGLERQASVGCLSTDLARFLGRQV
jgi:hypothetical protein